MQRQNFLDACRWEPFKNTGSSTIPAFGLVVIKTASVVTRGRGRLQCDQPGTTFYRQFAVNGPTSVSAGKNGVCTRSSPCLCAYDSGTPAIGEGWGLKPSQSTASKGFPGLTIEGIFDSTNKIALVSLESPITHMIGKTTGAITGGTSSTTSYRIYSGAPFNGSDAGFTTVTAAYSKVDIDSGLWIRITYLNGYPVLEPLECNA